MRIVAMIGLAAALAGCGTPPPAPAPQAAVGLIHYISVERPQQIIGHEHYAFILDGAG